MVFIFPSLSRVGCFAIFASSMHPRSAFPFFGSDIFRRRDERKTSSSAREARMDVSTAERLIRMVRAEDVIGW